MCIVIYVLSGRQLPVGCLFLGSCAHLMLYLHYTYRPSGLAGYAWLCSMGGTGRSAANSERDPSAYAQHLPRAPRSPSNPAATGRLPREGYGTRANSSCNWRHWGTAVRA